MPPIGIALAIVVAVAIVGGIIALVRSRAQVRGYEDIAPEARQIAASLKAEMFRDGDDLVIAGIYRKFPAIIRFSYDENTPGLNVRMNAPASFTLSVVPKGAKAAEGRVQVRTSNDLFDTRFVTRSDQPTQAKMLLGSKVVQANLEKLCCSSKTFFTISRGMLELSELVIPDMYLARHVLAHVESLRVLAEAVAGMPGAETVKVQVLHREKRIAGRIAIAAGIVAAVVAVATAMRSPEQVTQAQSVRIPDGMTPAAAALVSNVADWRVATEADFDNDAGAWARGNGQPTSGFIPGDFGGKQGPLEGAYILVNANGDRRVVLLADGKAAWDVTLPRLAAAVRVPRELFPAVLWASKINPQPDGDGLLLVRDGADRTSGLIVFLVHGQPSSAAPADYQRVRLN